MKDPANLGQVRLPSISDGSCVEQYPFVREAFPQMLALANTEHIEETRKSSSSESDAVRRSPKTFTGTATREIKYQKYKSTIKTLHLLKFYNFTPQKPQRFAK